MNCHVLERISFSGQWVNKGFPSRITDPGSPATLPELGGPTKNSEIDSIQNVILLCMMHGITMFAIFNPDRGHVVIPFVPGYDDISGMVLHLKLDHITDQQFAAP